MLHMLFFKRRVFQQQTIHNNFLFLQNFAGPDLVAATRTRRSPCGPHMIHTCTRRSFDPGQDHGGTGEFNERDEANVRDDEDDDADIDHEGVVDEFSLNASDALDTLTRNACQIVRFAKQGNINNTLLCDGEKCLKSFSPTRFCGILDLYESLAESYEPVKALLEKANNRTLLAQLARINIRDLQSLVVLLQCFWKQITYLEADAVRLAYVLPAFDTLRRKCFSSVSTSDSLLLKEAKRRLLRELDRKMKGK